MEIQKIESDLFLLIGDAYDSNSTLLINGSEALLIEGMATIADAVQLQQFVEKELNKTVRFIICTHYFSDHLAALQLFPGSQIIAHENYAHTFDSELHRSEEERSHFREPTIVFSDEMSLRWGRFRLNLFRNTGHTMSTLNIDIPEANLIHVSDNLVGNLVYLKYSSPSLLFQALENIKRRGRKHLISSHSGYRDAEAVDTARNYLTTLGQKAHAAWKNESENSILQIPLNDCYPNGFEGTPFENIFHKRNLQTIMERRLFSSLLNEG